jgi:hypothetical protein
VGIYIRIFKKERNAYKDNGIGQFRHLPGNQFRQKLLKKREK